MHAKMAQSPQNRGAGIETALEEHIAYTDPASLNGNLDIFRQQNLQYDRFSEGIATAVFATVKVAVFPVCRCDFNV